MAAGMAGLIKTTLRAAATVVLGLALLTGSWAAAQEVGASAGDAPAEAAPAPSRLTIASGLGERDLARRYPQQAVWLDLGEGDQPLALLALERQAEARGAVLIVGDEGQSAASGLHGAMRSLLADEGWATMVVALPPAPVVLGAEAALEAEHPPGDEAGNAEPAPEASAMIDVMATPNVQARMQTYRERVQTLLATAVDELSGRGYPRIVLVGVGQAAWPVMQAAIGGGGEPRELVWVTPRFAGSGEAWQSGLEGLDDWPILDLANTLADPELSRARAAVFIRQGMTAYRQQRLLLADPAAGREAPAVVNRILAWLALAETAVSPL